MAVVNELVTQFSFIGDLAPQRDFNENLKLSLSLLAGIGAALIGAAGGVFAFVASNTEAADALGDMNAETGIAVEAIQELGFAAMLSGSSTEAMSSSLNGLSKVAGDAARGLGRGRKAFEDLGISVKDASGNVKTADVLFNELRESFARLGTDKGTQKSIIASLGLDPSTLQLLNATSEEIAVMTEKARALGIVTTEQVAIAADFNDSLDTAKFAVSALSQQVAIGLAPSMQGITDGFTEFLVANKDLIRDGLLYLGEVMTATAGFVVRMTPLVLSLGAAFLVAKLATGGFATIMAFVTSPVVLITAAIVALLLIVDDLITAFQGGQSVIADFFMEFFGIDIVPIMHNIVDSFLWMVDAVLAVLQPLFDSWSAMFDAVIKLFKGDFSGALDSLKESFSAWIDFVKGVFGLLFDYLAGGWGKILDVIKQGAASILPDWAIDLISSGDSPDSAQGIKPPLPSGSGQDPSDIPMLTPNNVMGMTPAGNTSINNSQVKQDIKIDISSSDPKAAGAAVDNALQDQLKNAKTQVNRGGR